MSDTPRTDAACWSESGHPDDELCKAAFARELERENAKLQKLRSEVYDWIERNNPAGFRDGASYSANLDLCRDHAEELATDTACMRLQDENAALRAELEQWRGLRNVSTHIVPGENGEGLECDPDAESVRMHLIGLQDELNAVDTQNAALRADAARLDKLEARLKDFTLHLTNPTTKELHVCFAKTLREAIDALPTLKIHDPNHP